VTVSTTIDASAWPSKYLEDNDPDLLRSMQLNAACVERTDERTISRNGYRLRPIDARSRNHREPGGAQAALGTHSRSPGPRAYGRFRVGSLPGRIRRRLLEDLPLMRLWRPC
jgi:hypothetical protein